MSDGLSEVSTTTLKRLAEAVRSGTLRPPLTRGDLIGFGIKTQIEPVAAALTGHAKSACLSIIEYVLSERGKLSRQPPELVWTGPEGPYGHARDTAVVLRRLFEGARRRVVLGGYSFKNAETVLEPLHRAMRDHSVAATFFVEVDQVESAPPDPERLAQQLLSAFVRENWPFGPPHPRLYCDRRALSPGPPWCSLHAKCVAVDGQRAFVSSANFSTRGQDRNIEAGVLMEDPAFAEQLERQWMSLVYSDLVVEWEGTADGESP